MYWTSMTWKLILSSSPFITRSYGAGKTLAWYVARRLQQA
jgi:hypothetical protein